MLEGMAPKPSANHRCKVGSVLNLLDQSDADLLRGYLEDENWSSNHLANSLREREVYLSIHTILKHRKGLCAC